MKMSIDGTDVTVEWEHNQAVADLRALVTAAPLTVNLSMYGGFEQVGPLGTTLTANDVQTTTTAGDIVLYSGSQIVVFYGSNSWAYTRLGNITSQTADGMASLLGNGDVSITIASGSEE
ncbi:MAG: cyclophilin-like fold protein [Coriobacteriales bacterium]|nr:cyclophilin-like fold protein [Coriobacteriales bacterium]